MVITARITLFQRQVELRDVDAILRFLFMPYSLGLGNCSTFVVVAARIALRGADVDLDGAAGRACQGGHLVDRLPSLEMCDGSRQQVAPLSAGIFGPQFPVKKR